MGGSGINLEELMEFIADSGITVMIKVDHERMSVGGKPWTLIMSGPGLGERRLIRTDSRTFEEAMAYGIDELRKSPGDWDWLAGLF